MKYKVMIVEDQTMPRELFELRVQSSEHFEVALSIDNAALADVYEPYLMQLGFLQRTPRGRCVTRKAYEHLGLSMPKSMDEVPEQLSL